MRQIVFIKMTPWHSYLARTFYTSRNLDMSESLAHALSGAAGGIISMAATYPLIVQGTREQIAVNTTNTAISDKRSKSWKDYYR